MSKGAYHNIRRECIYFKILFNRWSTIQYYITTLCSVSTISDTCEKCEGVIDRLYVV